MCGGVINILRLAIKNPFKKNNSLILKNYVKQAIIIMITKKNKHKQIIINKSWDI